MKNVTVRIETGTCKDTANRKAVTLMFVPEEHSHVTERKGIVKFERATLPEQIQHVVPKLTYTTAMAKMVAVDETKAESFKSFLTQMHEGVYIIAVRSEVWESYKSYLKDNLRGLSLMASRSILSLLAFIETCLYKLQSV